MKLLNLDEIVSDDREVQLGGEKYTIPGDLPVDTMLRILENSNRVQDNPNDFAAFREGVDLMVGVFKIRKPDADVDSIKKALTMKSYTKLSTFVFGGFEEAEKKPASAESVEKSSE